MNTFSNNGFWVPVSPYYLPMFINNDGCNNMSYDGYKDYQENNGYGNNGHENQSTSHPDHSYQPPVRQDQFYDDINNHLIEVQGNQFSRLGNSPKIQQLRSHMQRVYSRTHALFCIDVEAWEHDLRIITEIGIAIYDPRCQELSFAPHIKTVHFIIREYSHLRNGKYVPDNQDNFVGGKSLFVTLNAARQFLQGLIDHYFNPSFPLHCLMVGHDLMSDLRWLAMIGVRFAQNMRKLDTKIVFAYTHGHNGASLKNALIAAKQPHAFLHNAGNDAYYTVLLALKLCDPGARHNSGFEYYTNEENDKGLKVLFERMI